MRLILAMWSVIWMACAAPAEEAYDLLFRNGTLDDLSQDSALIYARDVTNLLKPEAAERDTGKLALSFRDDVTAQLQFRQGDKHRPLGVFPASVGNPMIMFFYESVIRDMAEAAGGSPYYIRNRVKAALVAPMSVEAGEMVVDGTTIATQTVRMRPFEGDPNSDRMRGFGDLEMRVVMAEGVPGWYLALEAEAKPAEGPAVYRSHLTFDGVEALQ